jgi:hypothetical protein
VNASRFDARRLWGTRNTFVTLDPVARRPLRRRSAMMVAAPTVKL